MCLALGVGARLLRKKRRIEYSYKLERFVILGLIVVECLLLFIYIMGKLYIDNIYKGIRSCYDAYYPNIDSCMVLCQNPDTKQPSPLKCRLYQKNLENANPELMLGLTCVLAMFGLAVVFLYLRKLFRTYRHKLELYQHLLLKFFPDKLSEVAVQNRPEFPTIPEDEEEYDDASSYGGYGGRGGKKFRLPSSNISIGVPFMNPHKSIN